jgi:molybdopterin converting factor small subunit
MMITLELFGVPRLRAGVGTITLDADTVASALAALRDTCPALAGSVLRDGHLHPAYKLSLNGERFVDDPATPLADGDALLLIAADAGG